MQDGESQRGAVPAKHTEKHTGQGEQLRKPNTHSDELLSTFELQWIVCLFV